MINSIKPAVPKRAVKAAKAASVSPKSTAAADPAPLPEAQGDRMAATRKVVTVTSRRKAEPKAPRSDAFEAIHSAAAALHSVGVIDKKTMRDFDASCFTTPSITARDVLRIRNKAHVSQEVLARYMGITKSTVVKWESADNMPSPMAQRLLKIIDEHGLDVIA